MAVVAIAVGLVALKWYLWDIVIREAGDPDRSMLFWGIPIVFIGVAALAIGLSLAAFASKSLRGTAPD